MSSTSRSRAAAASGVMSLCEVPSTKAKYTSMMIQSIMVRFTALAKLGLKLQLAQCPRLVTMDEKPISTKH
jgi:hypothetical protein